jgi:uncharacterized protein YjbI with pentapeptide repeats
MANREHRAKILGGVEAWNDWRTANREIIPDLREANLNGAFLTGALLGRADLRWANLIGANLRRAFLAEANLSGVHITGANLGEADLSGADLSSANLVEANLRRTRLTRTNLRGSALNGADLTEATVGWTILAENDLSDVRGLATMRHIGPSTIGIDTVYRSQGKIPLAFLRGAGVPENLIEYIPSLVAPGAIQFYSCFISYSSKNQEFADRLYADLQNKGVRCWFAPQNLRPGKKLKEQIDNAIQMHERLLLILSTDSINSSWVKTEIIEARKREIKENRRVLFPVSIVPFSALKAWEFFDADEGKDLAKEIREYYMPPDFSDWENHKSYTKGLGKLLDGLRAESPEAA